ncbi:MAG: 3-oxoacyl-[acyl-carrier-protein] reductase [Spirochaetaceae bacterium]|nr:3-oxoacyl-[acyl-carrier-protein] reductase [Spirochaetaceae bacterium]
MLLKGKKALITGGARGIGREIVLSFLNNGASVYYIDLAEGDAMAEYKSIAKEKECEVFFHKGNVAEEEEITAVCEKILEESSGIDILVNNAGITRDGLIFRMTAKDWEDVIKINLTSAFYISKVVSRAMIKQRGGSIVNIASIVGVIGNGGQTNYSASKAGLIGFTKSLAREVAARGVRVNAVAPGFIKTPMTDKLNETQVKALSEKIPLARLGLPSEVASVVLFLASELSSYVSGEVIKIDGGMGM